jgi:hypothetical protein
MKDSRFILHDRGKEDKKIKYRRINKKDRIIGCYGKITNLKAHSFHAVEQSIKNLIIIAIK